MGRFDTHGGYFAPKDYFRVNTGGSHDENPNGGVQIGMDEQGIPNLLEEGEPVYKDYVFSDNIRIDPAFCKQFNIPAKHAGKLYSEVADEFVDEAAERPNDPISQNGLEAMLGRLAQMQDAQKQQKEESEIDEQVASLSPEDAAMLEEDILGQQEQAQQNDIDAALNSMSPEDLEALQQEMMAQQAMPQKGMPQEMAAPQMMAEGGLIRRFDDGTPGEVVEDEYYGGTIRPAVKTATYNPLVKQIHDAQMGFLRNAKGIADETVGWVPGVGTAYDVVSSSADVASDVAKGNLTGMDIVGALLVANAGLKRGKKAVRSAKRFVKNHTDELAEGAKKLGKEIKGTPQTLKDKATGLKDKVDEEIFQARKRQAKPEQFTSKTGMPLSGEEARSAENAWEKSYRGKYENIRDHANAPTPGVPAAEKTWKDKVKTGAKWGVGTTVGLWGADKVIGLFGNKKSNSTGNHNSYSDRQTTFADGGLVRRFVDGGATAGYAPTFTGTNTASEVPETNLTTSAASTQAVPVTKRAKPVTSTMSDADAADLDAKINKVNNYLIAQTLFGDRLPKLGNITPASGNLVTPNYKAPGLMDKSLRAGNTDTAKQVDRTRNYQTATRYAGLLSDAAMGLATAIQSPDKISIPRTRAALPTAYMNLQNPEYQQADVNLPMNTMLASNTAAMRNLRNSGVSPSLGANLAALDFNAGQNAGKLASSVRDANYQNRNQVLGMRNNNAVQQAQHNYNLSMQRANILNNVRNRNVENYMRELQYNDAEEDAKYAALSPYYNSVKQALAGMAKENMYLNQINNNKKYAYDTDLSGDTNYNPDSGSVMAIAQQIADLLGNKSKK